MSQPGVPTLEQLDLAARVAEQCSRYRYTGTSGWRRAMDHFASRPDGPVIASMAAVDPLMFLRNRLGDDTHVLLCQRLPMIRDSIISAAHYPKPAQASLTRAVQMVNAVWAGDDVSMRGHYDALYATDDPEVRAAASIQIALCLSAVYYDIAHGNAHHALTTMEMTP